MTINDLIYETRAQLMSDLGISYENEEVEAVIEDHLNQLVKKVALKVLVKQVTSWEDIEEALMAICETNDKVLPFRAYYMEEIGMLEATYSKLEIIDMLDDFLIDDVYFRENIENNTIESLNQREYEEILINNKETIFEEYLEEAIYGGAI